MSSPLVRRLRLARTIRRLRDEAGLSAEKLAKMASMSQPMYSRLETGARKPDINKVVDCLSALGIAEDSDMWRTLIRVARDANRRGWWEEPRFARMGERQQKYADVESGATWIGLYHNSIVPGLLQTAEYIAARDQALVEDGIPVEPVQGQARLRRQQEVLRDGRTALQAVLEEQAVRRLVVDAPTMVRQLQHLVELQERYPRVSIRILPVACTFPRGNIPRSPLAMHLFDDPDDGTAALLETVNDDVLLCDPDEVAPYVRLFERTRDAALSDADSVAFIAQTAARLAAEGPA